VSELRSTGEKLTFSDLVDTAAVRDMMTDFHGATGFVVGIVDRDGEIVVQVGYRDICTRFHRACRDSERRCIDSDLHISSRLRAGSYVDYTCANGLIDAASPIVIDGEHLATIYTGQFFFEPPDEDFFAEQAARYGYDWPSYRAALREVPVVTRGQYEAVMAFLTRFALLLAQLGLQAKRRRQSEAALRQADKMEAVGRLAGGVAHDLNNMLQVILGQGDVGLARLRAGGDLAGPLNEILEAATRARALVTQLLAFGRKSEVERRALDVPAVVRDLMKLVHRLIGEHIEVVLNLDEGAPPVLADPGQVEQVLMNLCVNARDAMPGGGRIEVGVSRAELDATRRRHHPSVEAPRGLVCIQVSDTGTGIPAEHLDYIFEPFFTTKEPGQGTGLGLATVYAIAEQHGGFVEVETAQGAGSTFRLLLPAHDRPVTLDGDAARPAAAWVGGSETILLAEDQRLVREFTRQVLESGGYRVITAADGGEAIARFEEHEPDIDLLVLDVIMPRRNGREVHEIVSMRRPEVPVLFCSAYTQDLLHHEHMLDLPAGRLLQKPFTARDLLHNVRELLDGPRSSVETSHD
jgi:polar amino acid transport system substrate-binding protein